MNGKKIIITGAASGLGRVLCDRFLAAGARLLICDVDQESISEMARDDNALTTVCCDLGQTKGIRNWLRSVREWSDHIDVLINNVGLAGPNAMIENTMDADWQSVFDVNIMAAIRCIRTVLPGMKQQGRGSIGNVSTSSVRTLPANRSPYIVSKAAIEALTHAVAREVGPFGIRCNAVRPGLMNNERARSVLARVAEQNSRTFAEALDIELQYVSMRTMIEMDEVASAIKYLISDDACHVTGQVLSIDGGHQWES